MIDFPNWGRPKRFRFTNMKRGDINERRAGLGQREKEEAEEGKEETAFSFVLWCLDMPEASAAGGWRSARNRKAFRYVRTHTLWLSLQHQQTEEKYAGYVAGI
jgi:hypothetical protein